MKADALFYASLPHKITRAMEKGRYLSQYEDLSALTGWGATAAEADRDLESKKLALCQQMEAQGLKIPAPRNHDEAIYQRVWDAAFTSLLAALDAEGVIITGDATASVLTLAKSISEKIETAGNSPVEVTVEMSNALRCAVQVLDGETGGYSKDDIYKAKCQLMTLLGEENAAITTAASKSSNPKKSAKKKATA